MMRLHQRLPVIVVAACGLLVLFACTETQFLMNTAKRLSPHEDASARGVYKVGNPYNINGVWYYPKVDYEYSEMGIASWYGPNFHGRRTANGEAFDQNIVSAAHRTLPLPSVVRVTNLENGRSIQTRVNDRGPFAHGRIIDLSRQGAQLLGFHRQGTAKVRVEIMAPESRQIAAQMGAGEVQLARASSGGDSAKPQITPAPSATITRAPLDGAPGAKAPQRRTVPPPTPAPAPRDTTIAALEQPVVTRVPVERTSIYVQAGAFAEFENANRLRARLSVLGRSDVSQVQLGNQVLFRVRLGPIEHLPTADAMLERVIRAGYSDARIIVDR
jgi:rare lipoprotein A